MLRSLLFVLFLFAGSGLMAQPKVDIRLVDDGKGAIQVVLRPDGEFNGLFSSLVFTVRWKAGGDAKLGTASQQAPELQYMTTNPSGPMAEAGGYRYQIYAGFGMIALSSLKTAWATGQEITLMTIPVTGGPASFEIVNDAFTAKNNGDYYAALNGLDRTGKVLAR